MGAALVITFREGLEATLVVGIVLASLRSLGRGDLFGAIWMAVVAAVAISIVGGLLANNALSSLGEQLRQLVSDFLGLAAVGLLSWMILCTADAAASVAGSLRSRIDVYRAHVSTLGVALFTGLVVLREGIEWLFLTLPVLASSGAREWATGSVFGLGGALGVSFLIYRGSGRIPAEKFFRITAGLLILVAAGLLSASVRGLQEAGTLPTLLAPIWDLTANRWVGHGPLAEFLIGLFGWNPRPSLEEALAWALYVTTITVVFSYQHARREHVVLPDRAVPISAARDNTREALL